MLNLFGVEEEEEGKRKEHSLPPEVLYIVSECVYVLER